LNDDTSEESQSWNVLESKFALKKGGEIRKKPSLQPVASSVHFISQLRQSDNKRFGKRLLKNQPGSWVYGAITPACQTLLNLI